MICCKNLQLQLGHQEISLTRIRRTTFGNITMPIKKNKSAKKKTKQQRDRGNAVSRNLRKDLGEDQIVLLPVDPENIV